MNDQLLDRGDLARLLRVSRDTVKDMVRRSVLPRPIRLGYRTIRWRQRDIERRLAELTTN